MRRPRCSCSPRIPPSTARRRLAQAVERVLQPADEAQADELLARLLDARP